MLLITNVWLKCLLFDRSLLIAHYIAVSPSTPFKNKCSLLLCCTESSLTYIMRMLAYQDTYLDDRSDLCMHI